MRRTLLTLVTILLAGGAGRADPPPDPGASPHTNAPTVLLLDTLKLVRGDFAREPNGDFTLRSGRDAKRFSAKSVLFAGDSLVAVNAYLASRASADAPGKGADLGLTDYNPDALRVYPGRIQPIVGNLCAHCHSKPECGGRFRLAAIAPNYADPAASAANLRAVLALVDRADPGGSVLLKMLTTRHGPQREPAIPIAHHPALKRVESWAHWLALPAGSREPLVAPRRAATAPPARLGESVARAAGEVGESKPPHDAAAFNRAMHPRR